MTADATDASLTSNATVAPLRMLLERDEITKLVHNAAFERSVMARHEIRIAGVVDTLALSRQRHGRAATGGTA